MHECSTCGPTRAVVEGRRPDLVVLGVELPRLVAGEVEVGVTQPSALFGALPLRLLNNGEPTTVERAAIIGNTLAVLPKKGEQTTSATHKAFSIIYLPKLRCDHKNRPTNFLSAAQKKGLIQRKGIGFFFQ